MFLNALVLGSINNLTFFLNINCMCSCCDNHFIFTQAKHQHMVPSVKVSLAIMKQDNFQQPESENEWYVLLR